MLYVLLHFSIGISLVLYLYSGYGLRKKIKIRAFDSDGGDSLILCASLAFFLYLILDHFPPKLKIDVD
jgi:hypothetical protein